MDDLQHVDAGAEHEQQAADHEAPGPGGEPAHLRQEEHTADGEEHRAPRVACRRDALEDFVPVMLSSPAPPAPDLGEVMPGNDEIQERAAEEGPDPQIAVFLEARKEQDAPHDEGHPTDLVYNRVQRFPAKLGTQIRVVTRQIVQPRPVDK